MISIKKLLKQSKIVASAPCRIDAGGTWDIKTMALPFEDILPTTINIALDLRTKVSLTPFDDEFIKISSKGFDPKVFSIFDLSFEPPYGLFVSAVRFFGFHGVEVNIVSTAPIQSALGGSSTALVALIKALAEAKKRLDGECLRTDEILYLSYHIEDAIGGGNCGAQDHGAAVYGGVNQWIWKYSKPAICEKVSLLDTYNYKELSKRLLVAYSGKRHLSSITNKKWINDFLSGKTQEEWIKINQIIHNLSISLKQRNWESVVNYLNREVEIRRKITPDAFIPLTNKLIDQAQDLGCAARFTGAGAGGSIWAIGEYESIKKLRYFWTQGLSPIKDAKIFSCSIDPEGVKIETTF